MIIIQCDICDKRIANNEESGKLVYAEKTYQMFKGKEQPAFRQTEMVFCEQCIRGLRQYLHGQRDAQKK